MKVGLTALLSVLVICYQGINAQGPDIVNEIWTDVQPVGGTAKLNCTVARFGDSTVYWSLLASKHNNGKAISNQDTIRGLNPKLGGKYKYEVEIRHDVDRITFMLIIRRLTILDSGTYQCEVRVPGTSDDWSKKNGKVVVQVAPIISSNADAVKELQMYGNATLNCEASGVPTPNITWTRSDGGLLPILPRPRAQFRGSKLPLAFVDADHMGVYRCVADNNIKPPSTHLCEVLVFHPPSTRVVQNSVGQAKNRRLNAKLECIVQGHPTPTVTWWRMVGSEKKYVTDDDRFQIHKQARDNQNLRAMEQWYTLKIKNVQAQDYTMFICEGSNKMGNHSTSVILFETTECQGANCPSLSATGQAARFIPGLAVLVLLFFISVFGRS